MSEEDHIVVLEGCHVQVPRFDIPHSYTEYFDTAPDEVGERIKDATIVIITVKQMTVEQAEMAQRLKLIVVMGTGCGWVGPMQDYFVKRGITVCNTPQTNIDSCSGHALGLYFAVRRKTLQMHNLATKTDEWPARGSLTKMWEGGPTLSCGQEVVGIVGYGALGQAIEKLCRGVGMGEVVIAERKGVATNQTRVGREALDALIKRVTVLFLCCPKDASTENLIDKPELEQTRQEAIVINMARGGIVNEQALADALREKKIYGAATDVFEIEPGKRGQSPLLPLDGEIPNLTVSPHISWFAQQTLKNLQRLLKAAVEGHAAGRPVNMVVDPQA